MRNELLTTPKPLSDFLMRVRPMRAKTATLNGFGLNKSSVGKTGTFTPGFGYPSLTPSNLTGKNGILVSKSDNLQYSRGSLIGPDQTTIVYAFVTF